MHIVWLLLFTAVCLRGEFLQVDVAFEDVGCASCLESLEGRLGRVRGVERVEIDVAAGVARLYLAVGNKVRLAPLLSRITQGGTKILNTRVLARGMIKAGEAGYLFQPSGLAESYRLKFSAISETGFETGAAYLVEGAISAPEASDQAIINAESVTLDSEAAN